jgi:hypothetical protein
MPQDKAVTHYIEKAGEPFSKIMKIVRTLIHETVPEVSEELKWGQPVFKSKKDFCYLKAAKHHVNLGFMKAQILDDSDGLLQGTGKDMRHIKLKTPADVRAALFKKWFKVSAENT